MTKWLTGGLKQRLKLPDPDLSEAANLLPNGPAARAQGMDGAKSAPKQPEKALSASDEEDDSAPPAPSAGELPFLRGFGDLP